MTIKLFLLERNLREGSGLRCNGHGGKADSEEVKVIIELSLPKIGDGGKLVVAGR